MNNLYNSRSSKRLKTLAILTFAVATALMTASNLRHGLANVPGYDFKLRYHEVECLRMGIDPYDVVTKKVDLPGYALFGTPEAKPGVKTLHIYTPWAYTYFLPFSLLPEKAAGGVFLALSVLALAAVGVFAGRMGFAVRGDGWDGVFAAAAALFLGAAEGELFWAANYGAFNALLILLLVCALDAKRDVLAGLCWALLMAKPQIGLLFAIPLLLRRRFVVIGVAAAVCLVCALPPAWMCGRSPVEMILEVPRGCSSVATENGTMLIPSQLFMKLAQTVPAQLLGLVSMAAGAGICLLLSWRVRRHSSALIALAPAVVCSVLWSYCKPHDRVVLWLAQLLLALAVLQPSPLSRRGRVLCFVLIVLTAWPLVPDESGLAKLARRVSLAGLVVGCWSLPAVRLPARERALPLKGSPCHAA